jgi:hypothetical protein
MKFKDRIKKLERYKKPDLINKVFDEEFDRIAWTIYGDGGPYLPTPPDEADQISIEEIADMVFGKRDEKETGEIKTLNAQ